MKKFLFLLFAPLLIGQIDVVNTTTQLSLHQGTGVIILNSPAAAGGVYTYIDSTYSEGTYAFDHPYTGKQWAKLGYAINVSTSGTLAVTGATTLSSTLEVNGDVTLENDEVLSNGTDGDFLITFNEDDDSLGQLILKSSVTGTAVTPNDHFDITFEANDGGSTNTEYAKMIMTISDTTRASEDATIKFQTMSSGTSTLGLTLTGANATIAGTLGVTGAATMTTTLTAPSVALTSYSTITTANAPNTADADSLQLGSSVSNLIKVRSSTSNSDSVVYITGGVANSYYQFKAVHTDTTITFADAINANLILGASRVLDADDDLLVLFYDGTKWIEVAFTNNE